MPKLSPATGGGGGPGTFSSVGWGDGLNTLPSAYFTAQPTNGFYRRASATISWVNGSGSIEFGSNNAIGSISGRSQDGSSTSWSISDAGPVIFQSSGARNVRVTSPQIVEFGSAALTTNAAVGFIAVPSCAGPPTGAPSTQSTGQIPLVYDSTNNRIYLYSGGTWRSVTVA